MVAATVLWGSSGIFSVALFRRGVPPASVALLRPVVGVVFLVLLAAFFRRSAFRVPLGGLAFLVGVGGAATAVFQLAYMFSTEAVGVPTTVTLLYLAPILVLAAGGPLLGERPTLVQVGLGVLTVVGVWLTVLGARGAEVQITPRGLLWGGLAATSYAAYTLFGRSASPRWGSVATVLWSTVGASVALAVVVPLQRDGLVLPPTSEAWLLLILFGLLTIAAASFLFYDALGRIEAGRASITATTEPVVAALLATWLLGQTLTWSGWVGLSLVVTGVAGAYRTRHEGAPPPG